MPRLSRQSGFSLLELAVVLVVIGLVVGGVVAGRHLTRKSDVAKVGYDAEVFRNAIHNYYLQYDGLPGDIIDGATVWGAGQNGNGDSRIDGSGENLRAWQQLGMARLIPGSYTGAAGGGGANDHEPGENCPEGAIKNTGFGLQWVGNANSGDIGAGNATYFEGNYRNIMFFGADGNGLPTGRTLTPQEANSIEIKYDDERPATGQVRAFENQSGNANECADATTLAAEYSLQNTAKDCALLFLSGY